MFMSIYEIALQWMRHQPFDKSTSRFMGPTWSPSGGPDGLHVGPMNLAIWEVAIMDWSCQVTSHYLRQCWPRSMASYGVTRPQWVKRSSYSFYGRRGTGFTKISSHFDNEKLSVHHMNFHNSLRPNETDMHLICIINQAPFWPQNGAVWKLNQNTKHFPSIKYILKCGLQDVSHFVQAPMCQTDHEKQCIYLCHNSNFVHTGIKLVFSDKFPWEFISSSNIISVIGPHICCEILLLLRMSFRIGLGKIAYSNMYVTWTIYAWAAFYCLWIWRLWSNCNDFRTFCML